MTSAEGVCDARGVTFHHQSKRLRSFTAPLAPFILASVIGCVADTSPGVPELPEDDGSSADVATREAELQTNTYLELFGDSNRDGVLSDADIAGRLAWKWNGDGAFMLANVDDDDGDATSDAVDTRVNGADDLADLARLEVRVGAPVLAHASTLHVTPWQSSAGPARIHLFERTPQGWKLVTGPLEQVSPRIELAVEATEFASKDWDGFVTLKLEAKKADGASLGYDLARIRVAPFILMPSSARTSELYVSTGHANYPNASFRTGLASVAADAGVRLVTHQTRSWEEMWMQDTMEVGYTQLPGRAPMHVVLGGLRGADTFGPTRLGRDYGFLQVGAARTITTSGDNWADWMGNLEVSPPVPGYPLGRVFYGLNTDTAVSFHPDLVAFLDAQQVQAPFWVDTGWLTIKHVDELISFLPGADGAPRMLFADTRRAEALVPSVRGPSNARNQARLDKILLGGAYSGGRSSRGVLAELGLSENQVVLLPVSYTGGHNEWSNPVNSIYLNGVAVTGDAHVPAVVSADIAARLRAAGASSVRFVDDRAYQDNLGNVHCATNTKKVPLLGDFSKALPALP